MVHVAGIDFRAVIEQELRDLDRTGKIDDVWPSPPRAPAPAPGDEFTKPREEASRAAA
jgi:hypothetical protein